MLFQRYYIWDIYCPAENLSFQDDLYCTQCLQNCSFIWHKGLIKLFKYIPGCLEAFKAPDRESLAMEIVFVCMEHRHWNSEQNQRKKNIEF